jgi:hypothetical protein
MAAGFTQVRGFIEKWDRLLPHEIQLFLIFFLPILFIVLYIYLQIYRHRLDPKDKLLDKDKDFLTYRDTHSLIKNILIFGMLCFTTYAIKVDTTTNFGFMLSLLLFLPFGLVMYALYNQLKKWSQNK